MTLWTNQSVIMFARGRDPVMAMLEHARSIVFHAMESGWQGPPYDPIALADQLRIGIAASADVQDARTVSYGTGRRGIRIEFNPNRPKRRVRYSIAHEIAHTFFPDCLQRIRHRGGHGADAPDNWQLETLCNIGAAEILMPSAPVTDDLGTQFDIHKALHLANKYEVSIEAILIHACGLSQTPVAVFVSSKKGRPAQAHFSMDYTISSPSWPVEIPTGMKLPPASAIYECAAIGYTARGRERWPGIPIKLHVEFLGLPPYPGSTHPRVAGIIKSATYKEVQPASLEYLRGDALSPRGAGTKIIAHIINDKTPNWGGSGFASALKRRFPDVQDEFRDWAKEHPQQFKLGSIHVADVTEDLYSVQMIAQSGYGPSAKPRIRYQPLYDCLVAVSNLASDRHASVHMPRIGTGHARGHWPMIEDLIYETLISHGISATVYDLPSATTSQEYSAQGALNL